MTNWKQSKYPSGTSVKVILLNKKKPIDGTLLTEYDSKAIDLNIPEIKLANGKTVYGYECWWIPVNEISEEVKID